MCRCCFKVVPVFAGKPSLGVRVEKHISGSNVAISGEVPEESHQSARGTTLVITHLAILVATELLVAAEWTPVVATGDVVGFCVKVVLTLTAREPSFDTRTQCDISRSNIAVSVDVPKESHQSTGGTTPVITHLTVLVATWCFISTIRTPLAEGDIPGFCFKVVATICTGEPPLDRRVEINISGCDVAVLGRMPRLIHPQRRCTTPVETDGTRCVLAPFPLFDGTLDGLDFLVVHCVGGIGKRALRHG